MSTYTLQKILKLIEKASSPENLNLRYEDLSEIDLSSSAVRKELEKTGKKSAPWYSQDTGGINLQGADLFEADLRSAVLVRANLSEARLNHANLQGAHLEEANLREAYLVGANLEAAHLDRANLEKADLSMANLQKAATYNANLQGTRLWKSNLSDTDLSIVGSLAGIYWAGCVLNRTYMRWIQLVPPIGEELDKDFLGAAEAYFVLWENFKSIGRYDDASEAYRKARQMQKITHSPRFAMRFYGHELPPEAKE